MNNPMQMLNQMMSLQVQTKMNQLMTQLGQQNPQAMQFLNQLKQNNGDVLSVYKQMRNNMNDQQFGDLLNKARQMGYPEEILQQAQQIK